MMRKPVAELQNPAQTWGVEFIAEVQSEFRHWIDELDDNPTAPATAYDAAGRLLSCPLVWESTLNARIAAATGASGPGARDVEEDLEQPLHLLARSSSGTDAGGAPVALREITVKSAVLAGAVRTIFAAQDALDDEVSRSSDFAAVRDRVVADLPRRRSG